MLNHLFERATFLYHITHIHLVHIYCRNLNLFSFSATEWWQFAIQSKLSHIQDRNRRLTKTFITSRVKDIVIYMNIYSAQLMKDVLDSDMKVYILYRSTNISTHLLWVQGLQYWSWLFIILLNMTIWLVESDLCLRINQWYGCYIGLVP